MPLTPEKKVIFSIIGGVVALGILLTIILVPMSLHRVNFDEVAISYNTLTRNLGDEILREGLHNLGPSGSLIKFKTTQQEVKLDNLFTLTADGLWVTLDVSVSYTIDVEDIRKIIDDFKDEEGHAAYIEMLCGSVSRGTSIEFTADRFYLQREDFQNTLQSRIGQAMAAPEVYATMNFAQVVNIDLPSDIETALVATTTAEQDIANAQTERDRQVQAAQIDLKLAQEQAAITLLNAERQAAAIDQQTEQAVLVERNRMLLRAYAFSNISAGLGKGGDFFVTSYLKSLALQENQGKTIIGL